jgi:two-component system nitrate/nitrite response regulator NarL
MIGPSDQRLPDSAIKILIVDDNLAIRSALRQELSGHPRWEICGEAQNGKEAIEKVHTLKPDLVILDISMPVINGFETSREIRRIAPSVKILLHSLHDSPHLVVAARGAGADAIANKSKIATTLTTVVERLVRRSTCI